jgi:sugar phosphate isomerase/epimerase
MKILFSTGCLYYLPIKDIFDLAGEAGFDGCDLVINAHFNQKNYIDTVKECLQTLPVCSIHSPFVNMVSWGNKTNALLQTMEIAGQLHAEVVNFHPPSWFRMEMQFYKWFKKIQDFQKELGCKNMALTIENMPLSGKRLMLAPYVLNDYKDMVEFGVRKNLYFTFDTTHFATFGDDVIAAFLTVFKTGRLKNVHISDYGDSGSHLFLGSGELPIVKLLSTMMRLGYDGMITLEVSPNELPRTREWLVKTMKYQLALLKMNLGKEL